ncbi:hypothetical protein BASA60_004601 [Batrachochytrium salamandrivorans]|nr:hypothetical protein BASA60_004601 [Batrachochytrium salamandrivorans]
MVQPNVIYVLYPFVLARVAPSEDHQAALKHEFFSYYEEHWVITMISLYGLFILLLTAEAIHAQGNTDDGDDADQASDSRDTPKKVNGRPARPPLPINLPKPLQGSNTPDQSGASSSADLQPKKVCTGEHGIRKISKSCSQQQSEPEPELHPSTSHDPSQPDEMPLPAYFKMGIFQYYTHFRKTKQYRIFTEKEGMYFRSEYSSKEKLGRGKFGAVYLATKKSNGMEVAYKSIPKSKVRRYTLESNTSPICHPHNPLVGSEEPSVAQCMSSRPPNLLLPYEFMLQMYLSRPGHENPYVPEVFDYFILKNGFVLVMEYFGDKWVSLLSYLKKRKRLDIEHARNIIKEVINGMLSLKQHGVVHRDLHVGNVMYNPETGSVKLIDFGMTSTLPGWKEGKSFPLKSSEPSSPASGYKAGIKELKSMKMLGYVLYMILTGKSPYIKSLDYGATMRKTILLDPDSSKFELKENAIDLVNILASLDSDRMPSIEAIPNHSFFV